MWPMHPPSPMHTGAPSLWLFAYRWSLDPGRATVSCRVSTLPHVRLGGSASALSHRRRQRLHALPRPRLLRGLRCSVGGRRDVLWRVRAVSSVSRGLAARRVGGGCVCAAALDGNPADEVWSAHRPGGSVERIAAAGAAVEGGARGTGSTPPGAARGAWLQSARAAGAWLVPGGGRRARAVGARAMAGDTASVEAVSAGARTQRGGRVRRARGRRRASRDPAR